MANKIVFDDGREVALSKETTERLRKELLAPPEYKDANLRCRITKNKLYPIALTTSGVREDWEVTRDVADVKKYIEALQEMVEYCEQNDLGVY